MLDESICHFRSVGSDFGHIARSSGLAKTIVQGTTKGNGRTCRQIKRREDNTNRQIWTLLAWLWPLKTGLGGKG